MNDTRGMRQPLPSGAWSQTDGVRRTIVLTVLAVFLFVAVLVWSFWFVTKDSDHGQKPFIVGISSVLEKDIQKKGPQYESDASGKTRGMWLDLYQGKLVAFSAETAPGSGCDITWRRTRYVELCDETDLEKKTMQQFPLRILRGGDTDDGVEVDTSKVITP